MRSSRVYVVEGIVLKRRSSGEADRMLTVFTKQYGKIHVSAKGIRRIVSRRAGHLEIFNHVILTLHQGRLIDTITEAQSVFRGNVFASDISKVGYAYCFCELVDQLLPEKQEQRDVFILLRDSLLSLDQSRSIEESQKILADFIHHLLWNLGYLPHDKTLIYDRMKPYVESITERKFRSWPLLTTFTSAS